MLRSLAALFYPAHLRRKSERLTVELERRWVADTAYRPGPRCSDTEDPRVILWLAADQVRGRYGVAVTSGDVLVLSNELVRYIDECRSYQGGLEMIVRAVHEHSFRNLVGTKMRKYLSPGDVVMISSLVASQARPEAFKEFQVQVGEVPETPQG